jgi:hypothetical protein
VWQFGTGNRKCRWRTRVIPSGKMKWFRHFEPFELRAPCKAGGV